MEKRRIINEMRAIDQRLNTVEKKMDNLQSFYDEVKKLVREKGKTDFVKRQELEELIVKYGGE